MRLDVHILSIGYLKDKALCFTKVTEHNNIGFNRKVVENENGKKDGKETVINSEEEMSKKRVQRKIKRDAARVLFFAAVLKLSALTSASDSVPGLSVTLPGSFPAIPGSSIAMPGLSAALLGSSAALLRLSTPLSASVFMPGMSAFVPPSVSAPVFPRLSPLLFLILSLSKTPMPNLGKGRQKFDNTISEWSRRSKKTSSKELWSRRIKKVALEEAFLPKAPLFLLFFLSNGMQKKI